MSNDPRVPPLKYSEAPASPSRDDERGASTLRRELDRITGEIETRSAAERRYPELGLRTPEALDHYDG